VTPLESATYLSLKALSAYGGLSVRTLRGYLTSTTHPLPHYRVGRKLLVKRSEFDAWIARFRDAGRPTVNIDELTDEVLRGL
jgi:excisionase family DNA binding protein